MSAVSDDLPEARPAAAVLRFRPARPLIPVGPRPRPSTRFLLPLVAAVVVLSLPLLTAAHDARPAPYGDRIAVHAPSADRATGQEPRPRVEGRRVRAYAAGGEPRWTYSRPGHRAVAVQAAPGHAFTLWSDGMVTDTVRGDGSAVRWHRVVPDSAGAGGGAGVLQPLDPAAGMLAVVTPRRIVAFRSRDGDLRWVLPARPGCAFDPARTLRQERRLLIAQPCAGGGDRPEASWQGRLIAVDGLGRIVPRRSPLGNGVDVPGPARNGNALAPHR